MTPISLDPAQKLYVKIANTVKIQSLFGRRVTGSAAQNADANFLPKQEAQPLSAIATVKTPCGSSLARFLRTRVDEWNVDDIWMMNEIRMKVGWMKYGEMGIVLPLCFFFIF